MGTMIIKTSGKTTIEMTESSRRGFAEDEGVKLKREI
jgi:hypothetical protein